MREGGEAVVYGEAVRGITRQQSVIDGLRSRAGTLFSVASLVTAFLGGQVLTREPDFTSLTWVAVGAFVALFLLVLSILWPWKFRFVLSATILLEDHIDKSLPELQGYLATVWEENYDWNQVRVTKLHLVFRLACIALSVEVLAWLWSLAGR